MGTPTHTQEIPASLAGAPTESVPDACRMVFEHSEANGVIELRREIYGASVWVDGLQVAYVDLYYRASSGREELLRESPKHNSVLLCTHAVYGDSEGMLQYIREEDGRIVSRTYNELPRALYVHTTRCAPQLTDTSLVLYEEVPEAWRAQPHV